MSVIASLNQLIAYEVITLIYLFFSVTTLCLYIYRRNESCIKARSLPLTVFGNIAGTLEAFINGWLNGYSEFPCFLSLTSSNIFLLLCLWCFFLRGIRVIVKYRVQEMMFNMRLSHKSGGLHSTSQSGSSHLTGRDHADSTDLNNVNTNISTTTSATNANANTNANMNANAKSNNNSNSNHNVKGYSTDEQEKHWLWRYRHWFADPNLKLLIAAFFVFTVIANFIIIAFSKQDSIYPVVSVMKCGFSWESVFALAGCFIFVFVGIPILWKGLRGVDDTYGLKKGKPQISKYIFFFVDLDDLKSLLSFFLYIFYNVILIHSFFSFVLFSFFLFVLLFYIRISLGWLLGYTLSHSIHGVD